MTQLLTNHTLTWRMRLCEGGYTCLELVEEYVMNRSYGRRWGRIVNAGTSGWTAHVGDWGQAALVDAISPPVAEELMEHAYLSGAKAWIEQRIADQWKDLRWTV